MQDEHRPCAFADDEVALPMTGLAAAFNGLRTIMDRRSILDGVARGSGATRATAFVATRQIAPQGLCLLSGPIDEGVDCLAADGPQPRFVARFQPTGDLFGRPPLGEPITTNRRGVSGILCAGPVSHHALTNLSSNMMANWVLASHHSRVGIFHVCAIWRKTRYSNLIAASSVGKCPLVRTARRSLAFKDSMAFVV